MIIQSDNHKKRQKRRKSVRMKKECHLEKNVVLTSAFGSYS